MEGPGGILETTPVQFLNCNSEGLALANMFMFGNTLL